MERKPSHPGELLLEEVMKPCGITVTAAAEALHVSRKQLSELVNQRCILTPEMAVRIGTWTRTSPEMWLGMQNTLSLWEARQQKRQPIQALAACKV
ncbi:MAG: addiction module antidote protein, HigA family [Spirochaetes bacterium]|nr:MAG: addiction module antidote protein, HigA family [Spirochaetota bacterium]